jgi:F-type H+-transporting ATPase subunit b
VPEAETSAQTQTEVAHERGGMPQLNPDYVAPQLFWLVVSFALLYILMSRVALPRIAGVMEERRDKIARDLDKAESLKKEADAALATYEKALGEARARAQAIAAEMRTKLKAETDRLRAELDAKLTAKTSDAEARIRSAKEAALANLKPAASEVAVAIVGKLLGETGEAETAERAVEAAFKSD